MRYALVLVALLSVGLLPAWSLTAEQEVKLLASDGAEYDGFGVHVALDGDTAIIGAPYQDENGESSGAAYVFTRTAGVWTEQAVLLPADGATHDKFGASVALDGDTAVIGAWADDDNGDASGSAYVFTRTGGVWTEQAKLLPPDGTEFDFFGQSVAIDGDVVLVGAPYSHSWLGAAYVFVRAGNVWTEQDILTTYDGESGDRLGFSVAIDGITAIVGAPLEAEDSLWVGSAYVFIRDGGSWWEEAKLQSADITLDGSFARDVAIDGDTAIISAYGDDDNGSDSGAAYVFTRTDNLWTEQAKLLASDGAAQDFFGIAVDLADDGNTALIGASDDEVSGIVSGSAYLFTRVAAVWTEQAKLVASDGDADDFFGDRVALDAGTILVGAAWNNDNGPDSGSAYVFRVCDHRMTVTTDEEDTQLFISPDPGFFRIVSGSLADLHADEYFFRAACLDPSAENPTVDPLPDPPAGDGRYYLARPLEYCEGEGYGESSLTPDPRDFLVLFDPCP